MKKILLTTFFSLFLIFFLISETFEEIYAIVNDEIITLSELKKFEREMMRMLQSQYQGEELNKKFSEMRSNLLEQLIEQKLIESKLKEKKYDVEADVELIIKEIKKQNNIESDDKLIEALRSEGIDFENWKDFLRKKRAQDRLFYEEIGSKLKVDNAQIVEYYKKNINNFTEPEKRKISAIYIPKSPENNFLSLKEEINHFLQENSFDQAALKYSQLPDEEKKELGTFAYKDLEPSLAEAAWSLQKGHLSDWIETTNGYYLLRVEEIFPEKITPLNEVQSEIQETIRLQLQELKIKEYIAQLKKDSYIKILKEY